MNVLVTGLDGFVGGHLGELLLSGSGGRLTGFVVKKTETPVIARHADRIDLIEGDIRNKDEVFAAIERSSPDVIYHLAGQAYVPNSLKDPLDTYRVNIDGGIHILEGVRKFVPSCPVLVVSSGEAYGRVPPDAPVTEERALNPDNPYAASKACIDLIARQYRATFGVKAVVARAFNHLGPGQSEVFVGSAFARQVAEVKLGLRKPVISVGNLEAQRDFTDVRDVVKAYAALMKGKRVHGVYNISSGRAVSIRTLLDSLIRLSGVSVDIVRDPERMRVVDSPIVVGSSQRLRDETGWTPTIPLDQTLADILAWWESRLKP